MTDERLEEIIARKEVLHLRLKVIMATDIPERVKVARIRSITNEARLLRGEMEAALRDLYRP